MPASAREPCASIGEVRILVSSTLAMVAWRPINVNLRILNTRHPKKTDAGQRRGQRHEGLCAGRLGSAVSPAARSPFFRFAPDLWDTETDTDTVTDLKSEVRQTRCPLTARQADAAHCAASTTARCAQDHCCPLIEATPAASRPAARHRSSRHRPPRHGPFGAAR